MGNAFRSLFGNCCKPQGTDSSAHANGVLSSSTEVSVLAHDLFTFQITSRVPEHLQNHVVSSKKAQVKWYFKLLEAWTASNPPPETPEDAAKLVIDTLKRHQRSDVEGLLEYYGLPLPRSFKISPQGLQFELQTLPIDEKAVADGDTVTVYVSISDSREAALVPKAVLKTAAARSKARARKDYAKSDDLHKNMIDAGYRVLNIRGEDIIARKYRIRLRGIDAPESAMPYGKESRRELCNLIQGKRLRVLVYDEDRYRRHVGDIYSNGVFVQEMMLKKGFAWHYKAYDNREELSEWEKQAREKRIGLWAASDPEKPWEWRKKKRNEV